MFAREKTTDDAFGGIDRLEFLTLSFVLGVSEKKGRGENAGGGGRDLFVQNLCILKFDFGIKTTVGN